MNRRTLFGSSIAAGIGAIFGIKSSRAQILENIRSTARVIDLDVDYVQGTTTEWYSRPLTKEESQQIDIFNKIVSVFPTEKSYDESLLSKINLVETTEDCVNKVDLQGGYDSFEDIERQISNLIESTIADNSPIRVWSVGEIKDISVKPNPNAAKRLAKLLKEQVSYGSKDINWGIIEVKTTHMTDNIFDYIKKNFHLYINMHTKKLVCVAETQ